MKPGIPQGTRDFSPEIVRKRQYILNILRSVFERSGFLPIETPAFENLDTLMGKYGEEGDRLIFKILNNGLNNPQKKEQFQKAFDNALEGKNDAGLTERALRYDLTIPFARFVVMHQNALAFPFRRYQMQPVWRADRPQKGRYREFWQCDADIVGSDSLLNEAELLSIYAQAFAELNIPGIVLRVNNRKILAGLAECCGIPEKLTDITVAIDKSDKIGAEGVQQELEKTGLSAEQCHFINDYLNRGQSIKEELKRIETLLSGSETARKGLAELRETFEAFEQMGGTPAGSRMEFDCSLARGLNYYTGFIAEVITEATPMGSIGGGGRYDDLTGLFGLKGLSGVGVSFGVDRIFDVMETLDLFPESIVRPETKILLLNQGKNVQRQLLTLLQQLRKEGIPAEIYPDVKKMDKQMKYADKRLIPFVGIMGEQELSAQSIGLKNMATGEQTTIKLEEFVGALKREIGL
ncbi:MAG TPA: histidine--tRNA ligase [Edaphocola sp.]|nr:histidine--tRNA ligase [Edaphocola sp.]